MKETLRVEKGALWDEYYSLTDEIQALRWWNRRRREHDLRARLSANLLRQTMLDERMRNVSH